GDGVCGGSPGTSAVAVARHGPHASNATTKATISSHGRLRVTGHPSPAVSPGAWRERRWPWPTAARATARESQPVNLGTETCRTAAHRARVLRNVAVGVLLPDVNATRIARSRALPDRALTRAAHLLPEVGL